MESTENKEVKTKRELALQRLKAKYPEDNFDDDEVLFGRINGDYDDYDKQISDRDTRLRKFEDDEKALGNMFSMDPRSAKFLSNWQKGGDPAMALIQEFGTEVEDILHDPKRQQEVADANKAYAERIAKNKEYEDAYLSNLDNSLAYIEELKKQGMTDDEIDKIFGVIIGIVRDGLMGKFAPETIEIVKKAINHDNDVATASDEGEIRGRNAKIDERLKTRKAGDGTANLGGRNGGPIGRPPKDLGALGRFGDDSTDIYKRGGEKRIKR